MARYVDCNICGSDDTRFLYRIDETDIVKCKKCGLVYNNPQKERGDLEKLYSEDYFFGGDIGSGYDNYLAERKNHCRTFQKRFRFVDRYKRGSRLLSVGCAFGFCLDIARSKNWETVGVEISKCASTWARENLNLDVRNTTLLDTGFADEDFDAILMWGYIQESLDPLAELREAYRILKPGGIVFLQTQNTESLYAKMAKEKWIQFKPKTTSFYFSKETAKLLLEKANFKTVDITSSGMGQYCSLGFLISRALHQFSKFKKVSSRLSRNEFLRKNSIYVNLFDMLHISAVKGG